MSPSSQVRSRIEALRAQMQAEQIDACIVASADPHFSEYLPAHWQARVWLSGFTGSAGTLLVTRQQAGLWTDGRYFLQAEQELQSSGIELLKLQAPLNQEIVQRLQQLPPSSRVAIAADSISIGSLQQWSQALTEQHIEVRTDLDLPARIWADRPALPQAPIYAHPIEFASESRRAKLQRVQDELRRQAASHHLLSSLDDIAWITNLRGSDVDCNPVFLAHLLIRTDGDATLFVDQQRIPPSLRTELGEDGFELADYAAIDSHLATLPADSSVLVSPSHLAVSTAASIPAAVQLISGSNPSSLLKALKSAAELEHIRATMRLDGAALVRAAKQLLEQVAGGQTLTELDVAEIFLQARQQQPGFVGISFETIAGYQANAASPHYRATPSAHAALRAEGLLLVDSGGQYYGGTTDITRMWALGPVTDAQRADSTRVLQGMIALSRARFPQGSSGPQLDALARAPLWQAGQDYGHGTGHGVGYFLNVHEGPHGIRQPSSGAPLVPLQSGMITSIEPGLYRAGQYGIRHENLAVVTPAISTEFGEFLQFETLTLCPFDRNTLAVEQLSQLERQWLDDYHAKVLTALRPLLDGAEVEWLVAQCRPLLADHRH